MSEQSKMRQSRLKWKSKAAQRADENRYLRKELARVKKERDRIKKDHKDSLSRLRKLEARSGNIVIEHKVDMVFLSLQLFLVAHIGFRAISRVLGVVAGVLGIKKNPMPSNHNQLGDEILTGAHATGPERERVTHEPCSVSK